MNIKLLLLSLSICFGLLLSSCIKDEPQWREADIVSISLPEDIMLNYVVSEEKFTILLTPQANYKELAPTFALSEGATISPASGTKVDFTDDVVYTVTSQDGQTQRKYTLSVTSKMSLKFDFDNWKDITTNKGIYNWYDNAYWANANEGACYLLSAPKDPRNYPTKYTDDAVSGKAAFLETIKGKVVFLIVNVPMAAGNMFMGRFDFGIVTDPLLAIQFAKFGQIHSKEMGKPARFTGYYKYQSGDQYQSYENKKVILDQTGKRDKCAIYAIIFRVPKGADGINTFLNGTNVAESSDVIAKASISDGMEVGNFNATGPTTFWHFDVPFLNVKTGKPEYDLDYVNNDYKIAIILSASERGDFFEGAVGSKLIVDELEIHTVLIKN